MHYKIRSTRSPRGVSGKPHKAYSLTVPGSIGRAVSDDVRFTCEFTEAGILFRPVSRPFPVAIPDWTRSPLAAVEVDAPHDDPRDYWMGSIVA